MRSTLALLLLLTFAGSAEAQRRRSSRSSGTGIPCGRSYIAANKVCHIDTPATAKRDSNPSAGAPVVAPALRSVPVADARASAPFVASALGRSYYPAVGCDSAATIPDSLRVYFASESAAQLLRYNRVTRCF